METDASGRDARKGGRNLQSSAVEHEHWKLGILQHVVFHLDAIQINVNDGVSVSAARMHGLVQMSLQLAKLASAIRNEDSARSAYSNSLTARQEDIMLLLDIGMKPKEIARQLTLSEATVRTHIRNARKVLRIKPFMPGKQP